LHGPFFITQEVITVGFKVGDKVIYPNHGIGVIEVIKRMEFDGVEMEFYQLRLSGNNTTVNVPVDKVQSIGIRTPIKTVDGEKLLKLLATNFVAPPSDWKDRFKEFSEKMRSGDIFSVAEILKHLTYLGSLKPLSFREKRLLERARYLVISELTMARENPRKKSKKPSNRRCKKPSSSSRRKMAKLPLLPRRSKRRHSAPHGDACRASPSFQVGSEWVIPFPWSSSRLSPLGFSWLPMPSSWRLSLPSWRRGVHGCRRFR
jgi:Transcriptional regulators, similar to M. xanthus CarD